ncbi:MAG: RsmD family RNA methyltransferase [archaeon]
MNKAILTKKEAEKALNAQKVGHSFVLLSLDLGKTTEKVFLKENKIIIRDEEISVKELEKIKENTCYVIEENKLLAVELFSQETNLYYKLRPTSDWPTIMLSSVPMHRFIHIGPKLHAELMVKEISPVKGKVLDTCCGLGYTSILEAQKDCEEVIVFERDENVLEIAKYNPYSEELFTNKKIKLHKQDVFEGVQKLQKNYFDRILHDPPTVSFAKDLYSPFFYEELLRILKPNGILYHYCPNPGKTKGKEFYLTIIKQLTKVGFSECKYNEKSSGITAKKLIIKK